LPVLPSHTTVHAGPHTAVRRVELVVNSRAFDTARRQITIRSLPRRPSELHSCWRPEGQQGWLFCRWSLLRSRDLLATPFRSGLPPLFWSNTPSADFCDMIRMNRFILSHVLCDMPQTSRGKFDRLRRATAGFTTSELDGYGLRSQLPAPATVGLLSGSCSSARIFAPRFFQAPPRGECYFTLALRYHFTSITL
jgi:hypothetical protein